MKKRTSRLVAITLALVLCMSLMPLMAMAAETNDPGHSTRPLPGLYDRVFGNPEDLTTASGKTNNSSNGDEGRYYEFHPLNKEDPPARRPFGYERVPKPEEPVKEPEKQPEKPQEDPGRIVTERFIKLIETGRGFEELWSNRESPVWTLGDIENYLARRAGRIPTAGVGFVAHH